MFRLNKISSSFSIICLGFASVCLTSTPVKSAENIFLTYTPLKLSLRVESLEKFAEDGTINQDLAPYLNRVSPEKREKFRQVLTKKIDLDPILVSRFFNTTMGQTILTRLGKAITIEGGSNGGIAMRGAIVQASFEPDGLTLLNILKKYPTDIQIQGELALGLAKQAEKLILATETIIQEMRVWTEGEAKANLMVNYDNLPDIRQLGEYQVEEQVWNLTDSNRQRSFYVDVYQPQGINDQQIQVIIFSHGLSSRPEDFEGKLRHLASYGYLILAPQHVGSDIIYLQDMFAGYHKNIFDRDEFINRPQDISFVIDELERRNDAQFAGKLDLDNVGVAGHSFGGYTALAIAGATIDFDYLEQSCKRPYIAVNMAILLVCRALELPKKDYNFRDERVSAVLAANPVNRFIFGEKGLNKINIPTMLASGSNDPATPPALEQVTSFTWLNTPDKYWILVEGQAHVDFSQLDGGIKQALDATVSLALPNQSLLESYINATAMAFFAVHLQQKENYRPYLQSAYAEYLSQDEDFKVSLISNSSSEKVIEAIDNFRRKHGKF